MPFSFHPPFLTPVPLLHGLLQKRKAPGSQVASGHIRVYIRLRYVGRCGEVLRAHALYRGTPKPISSVDSIKLNLALSFERPIRSFPGQEAVTDNAPLTTQLKRTLPLSMRSWRIKPCSRHCLPATIPLFFWSLFRAWLLHRMPELCP